MKGKKMKSKIFIAIPIMLIIVCIFSLNVFASENNTVGNTDIGNSTEVAAEETAPLPEGGENAVTTPDNQDSEISDNTEENTNIADNVFELMWDEVKRYISEILCALTFISSIIVALAYKKGLVPVLEGSLGAISRAVTKIKERGEEIDKATKDNYDSLAIKVKDYENAIATLDEHVKALALSLEPLSEELKNNKLIEALITSQTNMLHEVFMASSLPVYQKERVEAHFKKTMEDLKVEE